MQAPAQAKFWNKSFFFLNSLLLPVHRHQRGSVSLAGHFSADDQNLLCNDKTQKERWVSKATLIFWVDVTTCQVPCKKKNRMWLRVVYRDWGCFEQPEKLESKEGPDLRVACYAEVMHVVWRHWTCRACALGISVHESCSCVYGSSGIKRLCDPGYWL